MLTPHQIELIKSTVPILREHGVALTSHFYNRMLSGNPELRNVFNQAHQAKGQQQRALASAVLAYAENIENPSVLLGAVRHIAVKHATINIRAEQYDIVGRHLLGSIKEVLGDGATDELIEAWAQAYAQLAQILIDAENGIYKDHANAIGGWSGWRPFVVVDRKVETENVVSFTLSPADQGKLPSVKSGQFVSVQAYLKEKGVIQPRQYTVTNATENTLRITVKRVDAQDDAPAGAMSTYLHSSLQVGSVIELTAPTGDFVLENKETPVVFISAGIGITPIFSMLKRLSEEKSQRSVAFIYATQDLEHIPLKEEIRQALDQLENKTEELYLSQVQSLNCNCPNIHKGRLNEDALASLELDTNADVYFCGPVSFMNMVRSALIAQGFSPEKLHFEVFGTGTMA